MLKNFSPRPYQLTIFKETLHHNTLVVLPTGLGKTAIAMMVAARRLLTYPKQKILFLAPTKPLVEQQLKAFKKDFVLHETDFALFTGSVAPSKRQELWNQARVIFSTPQTIENDVLSQKISLKDVSLLIIDEAHRATGDYAYVFLTKN
ncbi:MAG: DEAD/DEAH box helicase, partial [Nanoarchaeota archaeon]|nr:DEAD/DEAH box helicase [Nanoarchaeota archaeon]